MPSCAAYGCSYATGKTTEKRSVFRVPRPINEVEKLRASRWLHNIGTGHDIKNYNFSANKVVCEDHFHLQCFQLDKKAMLLNYEPKAKKLVPGAIPTIFNHKTFEQINMDGTVVTTRAKRTRKEDNSQVSYWSKFTLLCRTIRGK